MTTTLTYLIGLPGAGKSTLMRETFLHVPQLFVNDATVPHVLYADGKHGRVGLQLGRIRPEGFNGTDALSMSIQPKALAFVLSNPVPFIVGEGDRLGNIKFFEALRQRHVGLQVVLLDASPQLAADRRAARGTAFSDTWLRGRRTKVANTWQWVQSKGVPHVKLDASQPLEQLVRQFSSASAVEPILRKFGGS